MVKTSLPLHFLTVQENLISGNHLCPKTGNSLQLCSQLYLCSSQVAQLNFKHNTANRGELEQKKAEGKGKVK